MSITVETKKPLNHYVFICRGFYYKWLKPIMPDTNVTQGEQRESSSIKVLPSVWRIAKMSAIDHQIKLYELVEQAVQCYIPFRNALAATGGNQEKAVKAFLRAYDEVAKVERDAKAKDESTVSSVKSNKRPGDKQQTNSGEAGENIGSS